MTCTKVCTPAAWLQLCSRLWKRHAHGYAELPDAWILGGAQVISDLLKPAQRELVIREDPRRGKYVHGLSEWVVRSPAEVSPDASASPKGPMLASYSPRTPAPQQACTRPQQVVSVLVDQGDPS